MGSGSSDLEDVHLMTFFDWLLWQEKRHPHFKAVFHVANERRCSWMQGKILKRKGVKAGIFDIICPIPIWPFHGLIIELKIKPNKVTPAQEEMGKVFHSLGWCVRVAWSGDEAIELFRTYIKGASQTWTTEGPLKA
jgi:hypothetical protein